MRAVLAITLLVVCHWACAERLPGYDFVGRSVDCLKVAYGGKSVEEELASHERVIKLSSDFKQAETQPADTNWQIPKNTISTFYPRCEWHASSHTVTAARDFQSEIGLAFKAGGSTEPSEFTDSVSGTVSTEYETTSSEALRYSKFMFDSICMCQDFLLQLKPIDPTLTNAFMNPVLDLPKFFDAANTTKTQLYVDFFHRWGTHVVEAFVGGGTITQRMEMYITDYLNMETSGANIEADVSATFSMNLNVPVSLPDSYSSFEEVVIQKGMTVAGGNESIVNDFLQWRPSVSLEPIPVQLTARPIYSYLTKEAFGTNVYILDRQASMNTALQYYLQFQSNYPDLLPTTSYCQRSFSKFENECEARCDADSIVIGGGCMQEHDPNASQEQWPWRMTVSTTSNNGWLCRLSEDYGTKKYHRKVYSTALCLKKSVVSYMTPPSGQGITVKTQRVECEAPVSSFDGTSCLAQCPSDTIMTGGGCRPSEVGLQNTSFPQQISTSAPSSPSSNAWQCTLRKDRNGGDWVPARALGFALCTNWTSSFQFRPAHYDSKTAQCKASGQKEAGCTAVCPTGFVVVGGGCDAANGAVPGKWRVSKSWPQDNGWRCEGGEDYASQVYDQTVVGYAICIRFNVDESTP